MLEHPLWIVPALELRASAVLGDRITNTSVSLEKKNVDLLEIID